MGERELQRQLEQAKQAAREAADAKRKAQEQLDWYKKNAAKINERALQLIAKFLNKDGKNDGADVVADFREQAAQELQQEGREATAKARAATQQTQPQQAQQPARAAEAGSSAHG